jgi:GntR family transcriptional repressor for pyruvate dehydrogenase complex
METVSRVNLSELVADKIRQDIMSGKLSPGDRLPTHEELCGRWGVSRVTVREALNKLQATGLLEIHQGRGTYVRQANQVFFTKQFETHLILDRDTILSILEARRYIETALVRLATLRGTDREIGVVEDILGRMKTEVAPDDALQFAVIDFQFHKAIAFMAKNKFLSLMLEKIQYFMESQQRDMFSYSLSKGVSGNAKSFQDHMEIFRMIAARNPEGAADMMLRHITRIEKIVASYYEGREQEKT